MEILMTTAKIQDGQIAAFAPSLFTSRECSADMDQDVVEKFFRVYRPLRDGGMESYDLSRVASALYYYRPLLSRALKPTHTKHVVEIGSGWGLKGLCWADLFASYVGIELTPHRAAESNALFKKFGVSNARVISGNAEAILERADQHGIQQIDLLVLYAVLEHLTLRERKAILRLAQDVYLRGGHILIAESPNRLCRSDSHSFQLPFSEWLPIEMLSEYAHASPREDLKDLLRAASSDGVHEKLYRIGRGISFHEFECYWDKQAFKDMTILNDGYSTELLNLEPFRREEWDLLSYCQDNELDVHRMFTRYWIDGLLSRRGDAKASKSAAYLTPNQIRQGQSGNDESTGNWTRRRSAQGGRTSSRLRVRPRPLRMPCS
jgi:hypothetical protein